MIVKKEVNKIGIFITQYSLLLYMLFVKDWKNTIFLWFDTRIDSMIKKNMKKCGVKGMHGDFVENIKVKSPEYVFHRAFKRIMKACLFYIIKISRVYLYPVEKTAVYGQDHAEMSTLFYEYNFIGIEDGTANYLKRNDVVNLLSPKASHLLADGIPFGFSDRVNKLYLTGRMDIKDEIIKRKAIVYNIKKSWENKSTAEKNEILMVFGYDMKEMSKLADDGRDVFLVTQNYAPLYCTYDYLVNIYKKLLKGIDYSHVIIKPHPADDTAYEKYFPGCYVLRKNFPFELVYLTGCKVKKIISLNSTSIYGLWDRNIIDSHEDIVDDFIFNQER